MKKLFLILVFCYSLFITNYSLSQWFWQNPLPNGTTINCVKFVNNSTGWIFGEMGSIMKTTNLGTNWVNQNSGTTNNIVSACFYDVNTGWALTENSQLLRTTNSGNTWLLSSLSPYNNASIFFLNQNTGWIYGFNRVSKTTNGGLNWIETFIPVNYYPKSIYFPDSLNGYISGQNSTVYRTTNGGSIWFSVSNGIAPYTHFYSSYFADSITGYIGGTNGRIYKTTNGGNNWYAMYTGTQNTITSLFFINRNYGWAVSDAGNIYRTVSGLNFLPQQSGTTIGLNSIYFIDNNTGYATGKYGTQLLTTNSGFQWTQKNQAFTNNMLTSSCFINSLTGWVGGSNTLGKTTNGGNNWSFYPITIQNTSINSIFFLNSNTGYAAGSYGPVYKTTDCGISWFNYGVQAVYPSAFVHFVNSEVGWLANGKVLKTTNGAISWSVQFDTSNINFEKLYFCNQLTGWVLGISTEGYFIPRSRIYKTTDGGQSWVEQFNQLYFNLRSIIFYNNLTGWATGRYDNNETGSTYLAAFKTTNGGNSWFSQCDYYNSGIESTLLFDSITCIGVGTNGNIVKTTNGGNNWIKLGSGTVNSLYSVSVINPNFAWAVGDGGTILKTTNGGNVFVNNISREIPQRFSLSQNYPNPFNPITVISFQLPVAGQVSLKIYDMLGREVQTLVNETLKPGTYEASFDGSQLTSGVYFYKLITDGFSETKKMLMIK